MVRKPGSGGFPTSEATQILKKKRDILIAARNGSINVKSVIQYLNIDPKNTVDVINILVKNRYLTEEKKDLPDGSIFYSYDITQSGHAWLFDNMSKKNKTVLYISENGSVTPGIIASYFGIKLAYASNILRYLYTDGLVDRVKSGRSFSYSLSALGVKRSSWIDTLK